MSRPRYLSDYLASVLPSGALQMRDPNDNAKHRYCWAWLGEVPSRIRLPEKGDFSDSPAQWESVSDAMQAQIDRSLSARRLGVRVPASHPIIEYFVRHAPAK